MHITSSTSAPPVTTRVQATAAASPPGSAGALRSATATLHAVLGGARRPAVPPRLRTGEEGFDFDKIGIIGGMGPAAGNAAAQALVDVFQQELGAATDQAHGAYVLISDSPAIGDRNAYAQAHFPADMARLPREQRLGLLRDPRPDNPFHGISRAIDQVAVTGARIAVITCNTAHVWFDALELHASARGVKLLHIVDSVAMAVADALGTEQARSQPIRIAQLATSTTNETGLYPNRLAQQYPGRYAISVPEAAGQQKVMAAINGTERFPLPDGRASLGVKGGEHTVAGALMLEAALEMKQQDPALAFVTGACTEVGRAISQKDFDGHDLIFIDTVRSLMTLAARAARRVAVHDQDRGVEPCPPSGRRAAALG